MPTKDLEDGPRAGGFSPVPIAGNTDFDALADSDLSEEMSQAVAEAPRGHLVCWGLPFEVHRPVLLRSEAVTETIEPIKTEWLVFLHTTDGSEQARDEHGLITSRRGQGFLGETVADYVIVYADGTEARERIRRRHHVGMFQRHWGENCFQSVPTRSPTPCNRFMKPSLWVRRPSTGGGGRPEPVRPIRRPG